MSKRKTENNKNISDTSAAKKAIVLGTEKKSRRPLILLGSVLVLVIVGGLYFIGQKGKAETIVASSFESDVSTTSFSYPADLFEDGKARHYRYKIDGSDTVQYFILKSSDGIIRAAFDACDVCWRARKGYQQSGDFMVCRNCGRQFASVLVNEVKGGCNPAPLKRRMEDGKVVIEIKEILEGRQYFDFSKRG